MATQHLQRELDTAIRLARQAGETILGYYQTGVAVEHKPGDEPVTAADRAADALIRAGLSAAFPDDGLLTDGDSPDLLETGDEEDLLTAAGAQEPSEGAPGEDLLSAPEGDGLLDAGALPAAEESPAGAPSEDDAVELLTEIRDQIRALRERLGAAP